MPKKIRLLEGIINLQMALIDTSPLYLEIIYRDELWKFEVNNTGGISFHSDALWVPDTNKNTIIAFNIHYISEIYATTIVD
jgi:hypothetical protein